MWLCVNVSYTYTLLLSTQQHVTPHIGETGLSLYLGDTNICERSAPEPDYDYELEAIEVLRRTKHLTDKQKMEAEFFDSKLSSLVAFQGQFFVKRGISLDSFEYISTNASEYDNDYRCSKFSFHIYVVSNLLWLHPASIQYPLEILMKQLLLYGGRRSSMIGFVLQHGLAITLLVRLLTPTWGLTVDLRNQTMEIF